MSDDDERLYVCQLDGEYFGWIDDGNQLFTKDGRHVGDVALNRQIFGPNGTYLGELRATGCSPISVERVPIENLDSVRL